MPFSLTDEHYLVIPCSLAATLGLEEAVMLQLLSDMKRFHPSTTKVLSVPQTALTHGAPFWSSEKIANVLGSLAAKGVLEVTYSGDNVLIAESDKNATPSVNKTTTPNTSAPSDAARALLNTPSATPTPSAPMKAPVTTKPLPTPREHSLPTPAVSGMTEQWQPRQSTFSALLHNHGIPKAFAIAQLDEFRIYWQDKGSSNFSWDSKFLRHVMHAWRNKEANTASIAQNVERDEQATLPQKQGDWSPSADCIEILTRDGVDPQFIENTVPEFVLYWRERGENVRTWNSKFIAHVRRQWMRFTSSQVHETEPHRIPSDWQPQADTFDIITLANIPVDFAKEQIGGFVLFWRESNQLHKSWNAKFLQHVKYQWAKQHQLNAHELTTKPATGKDQRGFVEKHSDTSWADDL